MTNKTTVEAYSGKYITNKGKQYQLVPEVGKGMCKGCAVINTLGCPDSLTQYCRQGYILKKVEV